MKVNMEPPYGLLQFCGKDPGTTCCDCFLEFPRPINCFDQLMTTEILKIGLCLGPFELKRR